MIEIERDQIQLGARPEDKREAIRMVGELLVRSGRIDPGYISSMFEREEVANTYLGNGICIPHGLPKDRELVLETGIALLQVPEGVAWKPGETARLIVGIAAKSDEHITVLRRLTRVLGDKELVERLARTDSPEDLIEALTGERPAPPASTSAGYAQGFHATIEGAHGLHARPATTFVELARGYDADVRVEYDGRVADGKSMLDLLQLGAGGGATVRISAEGPEAEAALEGLRAAIEAGLEDEEELPAAAPNPVALQWTPVQVGQSIHGVAAAGGIAIGRIRQYHAEKIEIVDEPGDRMEESERLQQALDGAAADLDALYDEVRKRVGAGKAAIFRAHAEFLRDTSLIQQTVARIFEGHSAVWSWNQTIEERVQQLQGLDDPLLAGRAVDLSDVGERVLRRMLGRETVSALSGEPVILVADDLTPSDTAALDPDTILGFCTARGGPTSHTAIIARSLDIPAVVAAGDGVIAIPDGTPAILDGFNGMLYLEPSDVDRKGARAVLSAQQDRLATARESRHQPAVTKDGHHIEIAANINRSTAVPDALEAGAEGVGLMRTEFLFLERESAPNEEEQYEAYRAMVEALDGRPLIIRTLDIGGDKNVPYLDLPHEENAFLGVRGIRLCLARPDLFVPQLRAIYRAARHGPLQMMFPMISTLEELEAAKEMAEEVRVGLGAPRIPIGIMIEVPSSVALADQFAREVDFFSIGTNDLTQYTLAMDRLHPQLARQADGLHPAVLRMVDQTVRGAREQQVWVGVCGGAAGDPLGALLLAGLGVSELSVSIPTVAEIKAVIRGTTMAEAASLARQALACRTAAEVRALAP